MSGPRESAWAALVHAARAGRGRLGSGLRPALCATLDFEKFGAVVHRIRQGGGFTEVSAGHGRLESGLRPALCHLDRLVQWYTEYGEGVGLDVLAPSDAVVCQQKAVCGASQQKAVCGMPRGRFGRFALLKVY